ncbi:MAG: hypothetical protein KA314_14790 [Chloroflexi bacterium]|nr:hypothetical protein [Chloroflexota bacterium]MBP8057101.1 hypothetical protein [Chloroflexota bacterium]
MPLTAYILNQPLVAHYPTRWDIHARYAMRLPDETLELPAGTWLLTLPTDTGDVPHYRLADGRVVCLDAPLTPEQATPLTDSQALTALALYRPLEQAIVEDWGVQVEQVDLLPPFRLIHCPLCSGLAGQEPSTFTTVGFTTLWCDRCQAQFHVRHTAGDPGFVVDCTWEHYQPAAANYLLPRTPDLQLTMVFKNSGDPLDLNDRYCHRSDCTDEQVALTDGLTGPLRAGLHACALGDVYDWSFYGFAPTTPTRDRRSFHTLIWPDGRREMWPETTRVSVSGFNGEDKEQLVRGISYLTGLARADSTGKSGASRFIAFLQELDQRPTQPPYVAHRSQWPERQKLQPGEKYLLHRWLLQPEKEAGWVTALPVWLVVTESTTEFAGSAWPVVRDNICLHCGRVVTTDDLEQPMNPSQRWQIPHGQCRETWARHGWRPTVWGSGSKS